MSGDVRSRFGARLRAIRTKREISQERLAELAGLHRTFVSLIGRGQRNITLETIEKLAVARDAGPDAASDVSLFVVSLTSVGKWPGDVGMPIPVATPQVASNATFRLPRTILAVLESGRSMDVQEGPADDRSSLNAA